MNEYTHEEIRGLPGKLPDGEEVVWQGAPNWRTLARRVFHVRAVAIYFAILIFATGVAAVVIDGASIWTGILSALIVVPIALAGLAILIGLAAWHASTTVYTITNRRVVLRYGVAVQLAINLPFNEILEASLLELGGEHGEIPLRMGGTGRLAYLHLWPHARPGHLREAQPMLRCVPDAAKVARMLTEAWSADMERRGRQTVANALQAPTAAQQRSRDGVSTPHPTPIAQVP